jgi:enoyl-CoA hydratase/carnithine racemase
LEWNIVVSRPVNFDWYQQGIATMSTFETYRNAFSNARLTRKPNGVLEVKFHTDGEKLVFDGHTHEQFVALFHAIGEDRENRAVILTGSGDAFMDAISPEGFDFFSPLGFDKILREGRKVLSNILDIEVPMITALNGPVLLHSEYALLTDIVLATPETVFQDKPHFEFGIVPGDGVHILWPEVIGSIRGRYFLLTRQVLDAQTAKEWGVVNEIVNADQLIARAHEIADGIAALPPLTSRYTRIALTQRLKRLIEEGTGYGLALEGISAAQVAHSMTRQ